MRRIPRPASLVLLVALVFPVLAAGPASTAASCRADTSLLREVTAPFPGGAAIVDLVADTDNSGRVWATDGTTIRLSDDAACSWTDSFSLQPMATTLGAQIVDLESPSGDADWLSAFILEPTGSLPGTVTPSIATTREAGADWFVTSEGLPDTIAMTIPDYCQRTCGMTGTSDGDDMNVVWWTEPSGVSVYWTLSGGRSYTARSVPSTPLQFDFRTETPANEMVTDDPGYLGLFGSRDEGAAVSDDGGRTWNSWPEHFNDFSASFFAFPDEARGQALDRSVDRYLVAELDPSGALVATHAKYQDVLGWSHRPRRSPGRSLR
ncbi:MAG: hypothetical protein ACI867_001262 [Glaciecola sp.]|jgi:hypothetical protein